MLQSSGLTRPHEGAEAWFERPRVLVVDDDAHDREIYGRILCYNGYDVVFAASGSAALEMAEEHPADLVLLDLGLPDVDGLDLLTDLRQRSSYQGKPVIAISGFTRRSRGEQAISAGCTEYIEKPASPVEVLHTIEHLIGRAPLPGVGRPPTVFERAD